MGGTCIRASAQAYMCVWRPEVILVISWELSTLLKQDPSMTSTYQIGASQGSTQLHTPGLGLRHQVQLLIFQPRWWGVSLGPHACLPITLLSEPSPQSGKCFRQNTHVSLGLLSAEARSSLPLQWERQHMKYLPVSFLGGALHPGA